MIRKFVMNPDFQALARTSRKTLNHRPSALRNLPKSLQFMAGDFIVGGLSHINITC